MLASEIEILTCVVAPRSPCGGSKRVRDTMRFDTRHVTHGVKNTDNDDGGDGGSNADGNL